MSKQTRALEAIIFDVDGTLADTEEYHRQAFNEAFTEFDMGWHWSQAEYTDLLSISGGRERIRAYAEAHLQPGHRPTALRELAHTIHDRKSDIYRDKLCNGHIQLRSGVLRLLQQAKSAGLHIGIATSSSTFNVETLLAHALDRPLSDYFEVVVTSDTVIDKKPSPAAYQFALAEMALAPHQCIAIEDTANGNRAALDSGLKTLITTHPFTYTHDFSGASLVVDALGMPEAPFKVLAGNSHGSRYVDISLLDALLTGSRQPVSEWVDDDAADDRLIMAK